MTASYNDPVVAVDELGREIRMTRTGQRYLGTDPTPTRPQATSGRGLGYNILDNIIGYDDGVDTPGERAGAAIGAIASDPIGAARGAATGIGGLIERLVGGTGTMGDVIDATGLLNLGSAAGAAPRGALRSGPIRVYHGGPEQITSPRATIDPEGLPEGFSVARTPDIARVYANMRGNNGGVVSEFEINPDQLRTIGEMDYYNFLDDLEMRMGVDREDLTDAEIRSALLDEGYNAISYPDEDFGIRILDPSILRPVSQTPAQRVAGLLSSGRADEVTDEMMAVADPQEMARLYASGATGMDLPVDEASRMARARDMGFDVDTPLYHGTPSADIQAFRASRSGAVGPGVYTSQMPSTASGYAEGMGLFDRRNAFSDDTGTFIEGGNVLEVVGPRNLQSSEDWTSNMIGQMSGSPMSRQQAAAFANEQAIAEGFQGAQARSPISSMAGNVVIFDPRDIRSRFARFDPRLSHLSNLNAANASPLLGGAVLAAPQQQPDPLRNLRGLLSR